MLQTIKKLIPLTIKNSVKNLINKIIIPHQSYPISYAQAGEDLIVSYLLKGLGILKPVYLDIGANDPINGSNTYLFYKNGENGVCIEPDPNLFEHLKNTRKKDACLNIAIGLGKKRKLIYIFFQSQV